jgi:hypothetical protein
MNAPAAKQLTGEVFNLLRDDLGKAKSVTDGNSFVN